jgi:UDP-N-acetylmuramoyl-tripeptide--D-alanyl-D-alanine ligase
MKTIPQLYDILQSCEGISTDTRKIKPNSLFFALKGENFNGNLFAKEALQKGAKYAIIDEDLENTENTIPQNCILVENVLETLQKLANYRRKQFAIPFVAIVGSNGKTTSKELIKAVLATKYKTYSTEGNLNNHIGVPITLLNMPADTEIAVIEMGANHIGENATLCLFAEPTHGVVTNVGYDHLEGFGNIENVCKAQVELYDFLVKNNGIVVANSTDLMLADAVKSRFSNEKICWYGKQNNYVHLQIVEANPFVCYQDSQNRQIQTKLIGTYNLPNIMVALSFAKLFEIPIELAHEAVASYIPSNNRSQFIEKNGYKIISDAYNANPSSMEAALENFAALKTLHKTAIIGDMFEMGEESLAKHQEIIDFAQKLDIHQILVCGKDFYQVRQAKQLLDNDFCLFFETKTSLQHWIQANPLPKGYILLKASRGIGLETILQHL